MVNVLFEPCFFVDVDVDDDAVFGGDAVLAVRPRAAAGPPVAPVVFVEEAVVSAVFFRVAVALFTAAFLVAGRVGVCSTGSSGSTTSTPSTSNDGGGP
jgi:hypothetical protein